MERHTTTQRLADAINFHGAKKTAVSEWHAKRTTAYEGGKCVEHIANADTQMGAAIVALFRLIMSTEKAAKIWDADGKEMP